MGTMNEPQATPGGPVARQRAHVVYDGKTGAILHIHYTVEFAGGPPQRESPEERARRMVTAGSDAEVIEVDPAEVNHGRPKRVDLATRRVVSS